MTRSSKGFLEMSDYSRVAALSRRMLLAGAAATCVLASLPFASASAANPAEAFMDKIGRQVVALFENKSLSDDQRLSKLVDLLDASVDFNTVARLVIGRFWRQASTQQRDEYAKLFREFTIVTIASQLRNYGGETYQITGSRVVDDRDTVVSSKIFRENGQPPTNVDWRVRKEGDGLKVIDVVGEGVSAVVTWRNEYGEVAQNNGFDGVIARLKEQIAARKKQA